MIIDHVIFIKCTYSHEKWTIFYLQVGLYQETVVSYDVITGDGNLVHATAKNEHSDLFYCLPWSHGTLGFLVALELKIIPVKPYVHMRYVPVSYFNKIGDHCIASILILSGEKTQAILQHATRTVRRHEQSKEDSRFPRSYCLL